MAATLYVVPNVRAAEVASEPELKSVFLFNFAQFVEWPTNTFFASEAAFVIGIIGKDLPLEKHLNDVVEGESIGSHKLFVKLCHNIEEAKGCQILFVANSEASRLDSILRRLKDLPVLTVSDIDGFTQSGGMIRFVTEQKKIRFHINNVSAKAANLTISSKILRAAKTVTN